jgi:Ca2+-binding EF-hand superfamily protein
VVVNSKELSSILSLFDVNGDGFITSKELEQVFASMADILANDEMLLLDSLMQNNGLVSRDEFLEWAQKQPELGPYQLLRDIFKLIDTDGNGSLRETLGKPVPSCRGDESHALNR